MKTPSFRRRLPAGFTLIELLTVMAIIIILAGLILGTAGYANRRAASSRAQAEIKAIEGAINSYQVDNGTVPRNTNTDTIDARDESTKSSGGIPNAAYQATSKFLFQALCGYYDMSGATPTASTTGAKAYFPWKPGQVYPSSAVAANGSINPPNVQYVIDPFGQSYGYSTIGAQRAADAASGVAGTTPVDPTKGGFNPVFDLWSTSGYGPGKPYATGTTDRSILWITNWSNQ